MNIEWLQKALDIREKIESSTSDAEVVMAICRALQSEYDRGRSKGTAGAEESALEITTPAAEKIGCRIYPRTYSSYSLPFGNEKTPIEDYFTRVRADFVATPWGLMDVRA